MDLDFPGRHRGGEAEKFEEVDALALSGFALLLVAPENFWGLLDGGVAGARVSNSRDRELLISSQPLKVAESW